MFGDITLLPVPKPVITTTPTVPSAPATNTPAKTGGFWDTINKILETGNKAVDVVQNVTGGSSGSGGYVSPSVPADIPGSNNGAPPPSSNGITLQKVALVGGGLAAVAGIVYVIAKKKKSK